MWNLNFSANNLWPHSGLTCNQMFHKTLELIFSIFDTAGCSMVLVDLSNELKRGVADPLNLGVAVMKKVK